jgi:formylglycine-generating enzyme required for sulfatase activity
LPPDIEVQGIKFRLIRAGRFLMGSPDSDRDALAGEKPQHPVRITRPFYLGVYPVTQSQYKALMSSNPSSFKGDGNRPVECVSWEDATAFCRMVSSAIRGLPTEAEWDYACRAGTSTRYWFGDDASSREEYEAWLDLGDDASRFGEYAWFDKNSARATHSVGQKKPNAWGLYDMHGNVWEWCQDWHDQKYYAVSQVDDPVGPAQASIRVIRGGGWNVSARYCRAATRGRFTPSYRFSNLGFRAALVPPGG